MTLSTLPLLKVACSMRAPLLVLKGIGKFWKKLARIYGLEITESVDERYHLEQSTLAAAAYLKKAHKKFGDWTAVAASLQHGTVGVFKKTRRAISPQLLRLVPQ